MAAPIPMSGAYGRLSGVGGANWAYYAGCPELPPAPEAEEPWIAAMVRPLTERSANVAKVDVSLPPRFREAFRQILARRNHAAGKRVYARDLHEEAISHLVERAEAGETIMFMASPLGMGRATLWMDEALKARIDQIALAHGVHRSAVVLTAFHAFLDQVKQDRTANAA
ncbi:hypothetical protein RQ734_20945 [Roseomonas mucosa]|uniref:hypothetical protein n=1 Tax=Roseomonas mucosa TaxID=207340 RepID=UPI0028CC22F8|nr:hypothetical protein [Roseomonas mucosa]MDT8278528.1 hypothetical protein [Roseomonas mucosa]